MLQDQTQAERLSGLVERVTFHSEATGFSVLRIKVRGHFELVTLTGSVSAIHPGESVEAFGYWVQNKEYGRQFQGKFIRVVPPSTVEGIEKYLGSGMVKGIGPHYAKRLVKAFGESVFDIIEQNPERLRQVEGIGAKRIEKITSAWKDQKIIRSIMVFLQSHGVSTSKAVRIFKTYGADAVEKVQANPYQLARDIHGIGFKSADTIAEKLGIAKNSLIRARAGLQYALLQKVYDGHCAFPEEDLILESEKLLEIDPSILKQALVEEVAEKLLIPEVIDGKSCLYPTSLYRYETEVAGALRGLMQIEEGLPWGDLIFENLAPWIQKNLGLELAPLQIEAVKTALTSRVALITGGPGTGKSTLTKAIVKILAAKQQRIALCSPTGRAAKRLAECTGMEAKTIHRTLGFDPKKGGFLHDKDNRLPIDVLLIDEVSMVDIQLAHSLMRALPAHAVLILVGDVDQLPSVGPGKFLADLIESQKIPTVKLTQVFRQAKQSKIIQAAHAINSGQLPQLQPEPDSDFYFIPADEPEVAISKLIELVKNRIPAKLGIDPVRDIQVLCPMQRGVLGARNLNYELQKVLNPNPAQKVERFGYTFAVNDKVMVLNNDYDKEVFNGDMGFIKSIDQQEQECLIQFDDRDVIFEFGEMDILQPAYTITIHKSQGSEYPAVVIPIAMQHYMMLKRNLIYTAVTRGKKFVVLLGQSKALAMAVKAHRQGERYTALQKRLNADGSMDHLSG